MPRRDFARRDFYDVWLPELSPSQRLVSWGLARPWSDPRGSSRTASFSVGCYCADETRCHRSLLRELLVEQGAKIAR